jgi:hypothetical protein
MIFMWTRQTKHGLIRKDADDDDFYWTEKSSKRILNYFIKGKVNVFLCLIKHHSMKTHGGVNV